MAGVWAVLAALSFSAGGYATKLSRGLTRWGPASLMFALFALGSGLQALAMRDEPMGIIYITILGLESVVALLVSILLLGETWSPARLAGVGLIVAGILLLETGR
jgi:multidrug transporter EmrE-like cation transporter